GVGTVAAGVAKAGAQVILISGYDGGTGAAPLSSIHNAGLPWELGLAETHQTLLANGLRNQVVIETDGKLMSGRDVAIAAILGAEEFGFATAPLITMGCVMMRACQSDTCPMGVATQNPELRKRFKGKPEYVENFMLFIAEELREIMASLGVKSVTDLIGQTHFLKKRENLSEQEQKIDLSKVLLDCSDVDRENQTFHEECKYDFKLETTKDEAVLLSDKAILNSIKKEKKSEISLHLHNTDRTFGTLLGSEITRNNPEGLPEDTITINCTGAGGLSFGSFIPKGLTINLVGDSNDYFGKGLSGGKLIVKTPEEAKYDAHENIIVGNVALYGATSGEAYIAGMAGERFAIRNSGATAVVEGVGEHGCEYMTGGTVVILGSTGKNFAAGMSGGIVYVLDENNHLYKNLNKQLVNMELLENKTELEHLKQIIKKHVDYTGSKKGMEVLENFDDYVPHFKKIIPADYKEMLKLIAKSEEEGADPDTAKIEAFKKFVGNF
ncbi:MAG: glutamate synthase subunit alpha, partial [Lachnospiraceae bacterium]|nr:glutamate synthase subunit alpha [Lachnospiraceae bacterium]